MIERKCLCIKRSELFYPIKCHVFEMNVKVASPKTEALSDCARAECRNFEIVLICLYVCINNAVRCTLHILSTISPVPLIGIGIFKVTIWICYYMVHACNWLKILSKVNMIT